MTLGWEFIKDKKRKQESNHAFDQEIKNTSNKNKLVQEIKNSLKKKRTCSRKHALDQEGDQEKKELVQENKTITSKKVAKKPRSWSGI